MHLHIPDGVLPPFVWAPALLLAVLALGLSSRRVAAGAREVGYRGALGALMLAAMSVELPLGPLEYHLTLVGPVGVLLGPAGAFQAIFVANVVLAFLGHGGFTVVGLNALVMGSGAVVARAVYRRLHRRRSAAASLAGATAVAQLVSGALWLLAVATALRLGHGADPALKARMGILAGLAFPMALLGIAAESAVGYGTARFLARVRPDLLPGPAGAAEEPLRAAAGGA
jgi:cobalt/nickel transport system permease protein